MWLWIAMACSGAETPLQPPSPWNEIFTAATALEAGDVFAYRASMLTLTSGDPLPPYHVDPVASAMQRAAIQAADAQGAAIPLGLYAVASSCGVCHRTHSVPTTALPSSDDPVVLALAGIVWDDDDAWNRGSTALAGRGLVGAGPASTDVPRRGLALVTYLQQRLTDSRRPEPAPR